jgi:hypothetical protein
MPVLTPRESVEEGIERYLDALEIIATSSALTDEELRAAETLPAMVKLLCEHLAASRELVAYFVKKAKPRPCVNCKHVPLVVRSEADR